MRRRSSCCSVLSDTSSVSSSMGSWMWRISGTAPSVGDRSFLFPPRNAPTDGVARVPRTERGRWQCLGLHEGDVGAAYTKQAQRGLFRGPRSASGKGFLALSPGILSAYDVFH